MPTYDYQCPAGHNFEKTHKMSDTPRVKCPTCGKPAVRQISGGAGLIFKGSGFYITDYGKDGKGARKPEVSEAASTEASKPAEPKPGTEKPAAKAPEAKPASKTARERGRKPGSGSKAEE
jgi:putative FmdB family regulatory protein